MSEALINYLRHALPPELEASLRKSLELLERGEYYGILASPFAQRLLRDEEESVKLQDYQTWSEYLFRRMGLIMARRGDDPKEQETPLFRSHLLFVIGLASLYAFLQSNVTGPPLLFAPESLIFPESVGSDAAKVGALRKQLIAALGVDGEAAYPLIPNAELLCLADAIMDFPPVMKNVEGAAWAKLRVDFVHERLLGEVSSSLQSSISKSLGHVDAELQKVSRSAHIKEALENFRLERATINTYHGFDKRAREDIEQVGQLRNFRFALTGRLGKRTKFQERDISQLVVLAKSDAPDSAISTKSSASKPSEQRSKDAQPENLDLNDDTLLEKISFTNSQLPVTDVQDQASLDPSLRDLDPSDQPQLQPLDSIILLALASSIKNTSPEDGLTREEMLPYATRVLDGGSSNWQIYTQALLVRSRIEGYRSRTMERGLLQLQALVDQVIADTTSPAAPKGQEAPTTFLPRAKESESAPVSERIQYLFQLATPARWELEAELAARWVAMGGLRSALEIYERLQMWAEVALCWAATENESKAISTVRRQLYHSASSNDSEINGFEEKWEGKARDPPPADAPRLYCILGDIEQDPAMYEKAWDVSQRRYARAQQSLGKFYFARKDFAKSAAAYQKALRVNQLNHSSWFALGCAYLELADFSAAVESFTRTVQLNDTDAEAWSNLAAALLSINRAEEHPDSASEHRKQRLRDALNALKQASKLQFDNYRILENLLTVSASTSPPSYTDALTAQSRLIDLRGPNEGEKCIDADILALLVLHVVESGEPYDPARPGLARVLVDTVDKKVVPLITASARLWDLVSDLAAWRGRPGGALEAQEKAWRAVVSQPGWEYGTEAAWDVVADRTAKLAAAYEKFGGAERTEGLAAGSGEVVMRDWKFKARTAVRGIMGRGRGSWEGTAGWDKLQGLLDGLKSA